MRYPGLILLFFLVLNATGQSPFARTRSLVNDGQYPAAKILLDSCHGAKYCPDSTLNERVVLALAQNDVKEAKRHLKKLQEEFPNFNGTSYLSGLVSFSEQDYGRSIDAFSRTLEKDSLHLNARFNRALAYGMVSDYERAMNDLNRLVTLQPKSTRYRYARAYWSEFAENYDLAKKDYEQVIIIDPRYYDAYLGLAYLLRKEGNNDRACEVINQAVQAGSQIAEELKSGYCR